MGDFSLSSVELLEERAAQIAADENELDLFVDPDDPSDQEPEPVHTQDEIDIEEAQEGSSSPVREPVQSDSEDNGADVAAPSQSTRKRKSEQLEDSESESGSRTPRKAPDEKKPPAKKRKT